MVEVFGHAFGVVFYSGAGMFALGLVLALMLKDVRLPVHAKKDAEVGAVPAHE